MNFTSLKKNEGQTLVELVVALGIAALFVVGIIALVVTSLSNITFSRQQAEASRFARQAMEWLREERDRNWLEFDDRGGTWCLSTLSWTTRNSCSNIEAHKIAGTDFYREATLTLSSPNEMGATVRIYWTDSKGVRETRLNGIFTRWR